MLYFAAGTDAEIKAQLVHSLNCHRRTHQKQTFCKHKYNAAKDLRHFMSSAVMSDWRQHYVMKESRQPCDVCNNRAHRAASAASETLA